jgi:hypothetical protein
MKHSLKYVLREIHKLFIKKELPDKIGIAFHSLEPDKYDRFQALVHFFMELDYIAVSPDEFVVHDGKKKILYSFDDNFRSWYNSLRFFEKLKITCTFFTNSSPFRDIATQKDMIIISMYC